MQNNIQTKPVDNSKLDAIISEVDYINKKIVCLEKNVSNKIEHDSKADDKENKFWTGMIAIFVLIFTIYPMIKDFTKNPVETKNILYLTMIFTFFLMVGAKLFYNNISKVSLLYHRIRSYLSNILHKHNNS